MTGLDFSKKADLYKAAVTSLKKFKCGAGTLTTSSSDLDMSGLQIKAEPTWFNRNSYRGRSSPAHQETFSGRYDDRRLNPISKSGDRMRCLCCESLMHKISECPHTWEKMDVQAMRKESSQKMQSTDDHNGSSGNDQQLLHKDIHNNVIL